jgi:ribosomal protein L40E
VKEITLEQKIAAKKLCPKCEARLGVNNEKESLL